ncbi:hypothetical protein CVT25_013263 [Psilocybe cyanescens]|uniref:Tyrosinase copper-binding domain-containing protein n=1 Tax=Psilocybe cyanescens TaxID=93625 RepID=A0A409XK29_PSICY|nr:hypothetical protein CVT25_013263 [Psilocybe cyanescens]
MKAPTLPYFLFNILLLIQSLALTTPIAHKSASCAKLNPRIEWRSLSEVQREKWISSVKCLGSIKHRRLSHIAQDVLLDGKHSIYDDFSYAHNAMQKSAHSNPYFLPWHRWFLYLFDTATREICGYKGPTPYWDWSQDSVSLLDSPVFDSSPSHGLGESGDCSEDRDCTITSGALVAPFFSLSFPIPHVLRRNLSLNTWADLGGGAHNQTIGAETVHNITSSFAGDFFRFQHKLTLMHNHIHNFVGGDLAGVCPKPISEETCEDNDYAGYTPNDPIFSLSIDIISGKILFLKILTAFRESL